ncbi:MAG: VacJ family lipoprotein [Thiomargarita sp.]|nr:VacJ family lipoprotein [Thiomargarita sp.]
MSNYFDYKHIFTVFLTLLVIAGCSTPPTVADADHDPFEKLNRHVFAFNDGIDKIVMKPIAKTYKHVVPTPVNKSVTNFFNNLDDIVVIANDLLQFKFGQAASDTGRFFVNSTVGLLGFIDVASEIGLSKHDEDFGQTLGYWGVNSGPYIVLPILGPSSARDVLGIGADLLFDPTFYYAASPTTDTGQAILVGEAVKGVDLRSDLLTLEGVLEEAALDKYSYMRDAYLSRRHYLVHDGEIPETDEEDDLFDDDESDYESEDNESEEDL